MKHSLIDRDKLNNASKDEVAKVTVKLFDAVQDFKKEVRLLGLAAAFVLMSEAFGFPTNDAYSAVVRLMHDPIHSERRDHRFAAMKYHLEQDLSPEAADIE